MTTVPFIAGRIIDVSRRAAEELQMISAGVIRVRLEVVQAASTTAEKKVQTADAKSASHIRVAQKRIKHASARHHKRRATTRSVSD
jgi:rare lipoprotein A